MTATLTRSDLLAYRAAMPAHARGTKAVDALIARLTQQQLAKDVEIMRQSDGLGAMLAEAMDVELADYFAFDFRRAR